MRLPQDLIPAAEMLVKTFQYPDHPEWGVQSDEQEQLVGTVRRLRGIWPLVRAIQLVSPSVRDLMRGFVAVEDGRLVGATIAQRVGTTSMWYIGTVGVLPEYRGRGIARQIVTATLDMMRTRGGTQVHLGVIDGNSPAQSLYRSLGFVEYGGSTRFSRSQGGPVNRLPLPPGYEESRLAEFDWRTRYELDRRIVPAAIQDFEPITPARYRTPLPLHAFAVLFRFAENTRDTDIVVRRSSDRVVVARVGWSIVKRGKGMNAIRVRLDPSHADLAPYAVHRALAEVLARSPEFRVDLFVPNWIPGVAGEAQALGFVRRTSGNSMGMKL